MVKLSRWVVAVGAAALLAGCQSDGPSESAMEKAWLAWAGHPQVRGFEKLSCRKAEEARWFCRFRTRHALRRGGRRATLVAKRSGFYQLAEGDWTYLGKRGQ